MLCRHDAHDDIDMEDENATRRRRDDDRDSPAAALATSLMTHMRPHFKPLPTSCVVHARTPSLAPCAYAHHLVSACCHGFTGTGARGRG